MRPCVVYYKFDETRRLLWLHSPSPCLLYLSHCGRELDADLRAAFARVLDNNWYIGGKGAAFEAALPITAAQNTVGCGSRRSALVLILKALGIGPGDRLSCHQHLYCHRAGFISYARATPVFVEPVLASYNIDPACIEAAITEDQGYLAVLPLQPVPTWTLFSRSPVPRPEGRRGCSPGS